MQNLHEQRTFGIFRRGTVSLVNETVPYTQRHQVAFSPTETRSDVPALTPYGFYTSPHLGADALVLHMSGDQTKNVVFMVHDQRYRMTVASGEVAIADDQGQTVHLTRSGVVINGGGNPVTITNAPSVRVESTLNVTGDVVASCDGTAIHLLTHKHPTAEPGSPSEPIP